MKKKRSNRYINYDYENTFNDSLDIANNIEIKRMLDKGFMKSIYATKTIKSGNQFEIEIYPEFTRRQSKELKLKKEK